MILKTLMVISVSTGRRLSFIPGRRRRSRGPKQWRAAGGVRARAYRTGNRRHCSGTTNTQNILYEHNYRKYRN